jgi:hypothetical protein
MAHTATVVDGRTEVVDHLFSRSDPDQVTLAVAATEALSGRHLDMLANLYSDGDWAPLDVIGNVLGETMNANG